MQIVSRVEMCGTGTGTKKIKVAGTETGTGTDKIRIYRDRDQQNKNLPGSGPVADSVLFNFLLFLVNYVINHTVCRLH